MDRMLRADQIERVILNHIKGEKRPAGEWARSVAEDIASHLSVSHWNEIPHRSVPMASTFRDELISLINRHSMENVSNTPDFILANVMLGAFHNYNLAVLNREKWYGRENVGPGSGTYEISTSPDAPADL